MARRRYTVSLPGRTRRSTPRHRRMRSGDNTSVRERSPALSVSAASTGMGPGWDPPGNSVQAMHGRVEPCLLVVSLERLPGSQVGRKSLHERDRSQTPSVRCASCVPASYAAISECVLLEVCAEAAASNTARIVPGHVLDRMPIVVYANETSERGTDVPGRYFLQEVSTP